MLWPSSGLAKMCGDKYLRRFIVFCIILCTILSCNEQLSRYTVQRT